MYSIRAVHQRIDGILTMYKRGFTIIELLVVVAIIAILSAILFPIFLGARRSVESASSASRIRQVSLAELLYQTDADETFVDTAINVCNYACPSTSPYACISNLPEPTPTWTLLLEPYAGSLSVYVDPSTGDPEGIFSPGSPNYNATNWNSDAQFGYNYEFLSPVTFMAVGNVGNGTICCSTATETGLGRNYSQSINPSSTVMFTTTQSFAAQWSNSLAFLTPDSSFANAPGTSFSLLPSQDRVFFVGNYCFGSSSPHSVQPRIALGYCGWAAAGPNGPLTADVRTLSPYPYANVAWVDGHVSTATASELAGGTDFATATAASHPDPVYGYNTGAVLNGLTASGNNKYVGSTNALGLAAPTGYLWSLDGTLSDIN